MSPRRECLHLRLRFSQPVNKLLYMTCSRRNIIKSKWLLLLLLPSAVLSERRTGQEPLFYWREMDQITRLLIRGQSCFETRLLLRFLSLAVVSFPEFSSFLDAVRVYLKAHVPPSIVSSTHRIMTVDGCATHNKLFVLIVYWDGS